MKQYIPLRSPALLGRLTALLDLATLNSPPPMELWPGVLPVIDLAGLLRPPTIASTTLDLSGVSGTYVAGFTVPAGKRWKLINVDLAAEAVNAQPPAYSDGTNFIKLAAIGGISGVVVQPPELWLSEGWTVGALATAQGGDTAKGFKVHYLEEDAYGL